MSAEAFYDAARDLKRERTGTGSLTQVEVDAFGSIIKTWVQIPAHNPTALSDAAAFFKALRSSFGPLEQTQVDGIQALLQAFGEAQWPAAFAAYGLATSWRETNETMEPVREAYYLGKGAEAYRKTLHYFPWYGRGYCQCTWEANYRHADTALELGGALVANPDLALDPNIAARIMVWGMSTGSFTGKKLSDYLPSTGPADIHQFTNARRIINGQDAAIETAENALKFQTALQAGGWA
jgi:predicted chitinase